MKTHNFLGVLLITILVATGFPGHVTAQGHRKINPGDRYPASLHLDPRKPIGPGGFIRHDVPDPLKTLKNSQGEASVHLDSMVSYSGYAGYSAKEINTYDCEGRLLNFLSLSLSGNEWENYLQYTFTYNAQGRLYNETDQYWDGTGWIDFLSFTYGYDNAGNRVTALYEDIENGFRELITSTYNAAGNRLSELGQEWTGSAYENLEFYSYTYDGNGDRLTLLGQFWDGASWFDSYRESWTWYASGKPLSDLVEIPGATDWENYSLTEYVYDSNGNQVSDLWSSWYGGPEWTTEYEGVYTYDPAGNRLSDVQSYYAFWEAVPYWVKYDSTAFTNDYSLQHITGKGFNRDRTEWVPGETRIYIPFADNGTTDVFANIYPSHQVDAYYSPIVFSVDAGDDATIYIGYPPSSVELNATGAVTYSWSPSAGLSDPEISNPVAAPATTTTYTVTGTDSRGCTATDEVTVTVVDVRCGKKMDKVLVCQVPPGNPGNAHEVCVSPNAVPSLLAHGAYLGPCEGGDTPVAVDEPEAGTFTVTVSPNPVSESFRISINNPTAVSITIRLYDRQGKFVQQVYSGELPAGASSLDARLSGTEGSGMYFLNVTSPGESKTVKLIRQ